MVDNKNYLRYKFLKDGLAVNHKGYDMKYVMSPDFVFYAYNLREDNISWKFIKRKLFYTSELSQLKKVLLKSNVIFTISIPGNDYLKFVHSVMRNVKEPVFLDESYSSFKYINVLNIITSFLTFFTKFLFIKIPIRQRIYFAAQLVYFKNFVDQLEKLPSQLPTKAYVASFSGNRESLYCQFFQKRFVSTYCLQHGLHSSINDYKYFIPADIVSVENFNADYFLGWGEYSKKALRDLGYDQERFLLAGNPKYVNFSRINLKNNQFKTCIFCLARDIYIEENLKLLEIASLLQKKGINISIKLHPRSIESNYESILKRNNLKLLNKQMSISESIKELRPDFVVVFNSTVYYEYYLNNIIAFRFSLKANDIPFGLKDEFDDFDSLVEIIEDFRSKDIKVLNAEANTIINDFCALGVNNYGTILNN